MNQPPPLCDRVRSSCMRVVANAELVELDDRRLAWIAADLSSASPTIDAAAETTGGPRSTVIGPGQEPGATLVLALDAINFGSGYHDSIRKRPGLSGARTMATALRDHVAQNGPLTPELLRTIDPPGCADIFGQTLDDGATEELMELFAAALNDLGDFLKSRGGTIAFIESAGRSAEVLAETLTEMTFYRDVADLEGSTISFYKRAQITPADLARMLDLDLFDDLHRLTAFADNLVPHVLRIDGALRYDPALVESIDAGIRIEPGTRAEIEIRAAGVVAVERLAALTGFLPMDVDLLLWERGVGPRYKAVRRHRTRSVYY